MDLGVIFLTGLTTGGLTCLAVQGGLLATTLARPVQVAEQRVIPRRTGGSHRKRKTQPTALTGVQISHTLLPVLAFLIAKLLAHTVLGLALGALGEVLRVTSTMQGIMQLIAGAFMLVTALNMLNVHPVFRHFTIQPPRAFTRLLRNQAKSHDLFAPAVLGALTVLIPCGTTQAMEILAISSGDALTGALIMAVFVLGTSPTFLVLGVVMTQVRGKLRPALSLATVLLILALGLISMDAGLNLLGSPLAPSRIVSGLLTPGSAAVEAVLVDGVQEITINARNEGYFPNNLRVQAGVPVRLRLVTNDTYSCAQTFIIPGLGIERYLLPTDETIIELPAQQPGVIAFSCGMGMYTGVINVTS